jgi:hypothetical protein
MDVDQPVELAGDDIEASAGIARLDVQRHQRIGRTRRHRDAAQHETAPLDRAEQPQQRAFGIVEPDL